MESYPDTYEKGKDYVKCGMDPKKRCY